MTDNTNDISSTPSGDPWLLTPGPLTTSLSVKQAMLHDYGSRDATFIELNARILDRLVAIVNGSGSYVTVPLQGSGTFVVEAMIGNFVPADGKVLILINGAYGKRIARICDYYKREYRVQESAEDVPVDTDQLDATLDANPDIGHVVVVHCETTSGILNPNCRGCANRRAPRSQPVDRFDERLRRTAARRAGNRVRCGGRVE